MYLNCGRIRLACQVVLLLAYICSCCQASPKTERDVPTFFVVVPGATGLQQTVFQGKDQIIYRVESEYPAEDVLSTIRTRLKQLGWEPLREDWLNPGLPSSLVRGWAYYEDSTTKPPSSVRTWSADWENSSHEILTYMLQYTCPKNLCASTLNLHDLRVVAIRIPADLAKRIKASIPRDKTGK